MDILCRLHTRETMNLYEERDVPDPYERCCLLGIVRSLPSINPAAVNLIQLDFDLQSQLYKM